MREIFDLLIAAGGIWVGWWACDIHHHTVRQRETHSLLPYPLREPPSNVLSIVDDDGDGLLS